MFFIETAKGDLFYSNNHPSNDVLEGLVQHWGNDCTIVVSASEANHQAELELFHNGGQVQLVPGSSTIEARDTDGKVQATWDGLRLYPPATRSA